MCLNIFYFILSVLCLFLSSNCHAHGYQPHWLLYHNIMAGLISQNSQVLNSIMCSSVISYVIQEAAITWEVWIEINLLPYWKHGYHCTNFRKTNNLSTNSVDSSYIEFYPNHIKNAEKRQTFHLCPYTNCGFHRTHTHKTQNCSITLHGHPPTPEFTQTGHDIQ